MNFSVLSIEHKIMHATKEEIKANVNGYSLFLYLPEIHKDIETRNKSLSRIELFRRYITSITETVTKQHFAENNLL